MATIFICSVQSPEVQYKCTQPVHTVHYTVQYSALCRVMKVTNYIYRRREYNQDRQSDWESLQQLGLPGLRIPAAARVAKQTKNWKLCYFFNWTFCHIFILCSIIFFYLMLFYNFVLPCLINFISDFWELLVINESVKQYWKVGSLMILNSAWWWLVGGAPVCWVRIRHLLQCRTVVYCAILKISEKRGRYPWNNWVTIKF